MDEPSRYLNAEDIYDSLTFNTDALFNEPPPEPVVSFAIGGALAALGFVLWIQRVLALKAEMAAKNPPIILQGNSMIRACISCAIDSDDSFYVIVSYSSVAFLFLGGIQLDYKWTLLGMIIVYTVSAVSEAIRVLLAFSSGRSLADVVVTSDLMASKLRGVSTTLKPSNVYEDLGRGRTIVFMTFLTQIILISFVCIDVFESDTTSCRDGTSGCPVGGTLGSWVFYVLGIFMACVFQLGPKTNFGQSEQNPAYWLQLLLATKQTGAKITWYDPVDDKQHERLLHSGDWRTWARFYMSFIVNGVGFHILVHALPIQVASQSSLTGVVFRAVGMMYLVDLDDTPGYTLTIVEKPIEEENKEDDKKEDDTPAEEPPKEEAPTFDPVVISSEAERIIKEAQAQLDELARRGTVTRPSHLTNTGMLAGGALVNPGEREDGDAIVEDAPAEEAATMETASRAIEFGAIAGADASKEPVPRKSKVEETTTTAAAAEVTDDAGDVVDV
eukprot:Nitzschia sp. Nitz4//scaffold45_size130396//32879//34533//NITZ4_003439-RA/size130396-snap-gene-0.123-mRNA-1//1//CDS//3329552368//352//frame0